MAFWSSKRLKKVGSSLIENFDEDRVNQCAYELSVGSEYYHTSMDGGKRIATSDEQIKIPPGQLALLITKERVRVPESAIAFISMKFGPKMRGLINVSGFHVDPGFKGRLKFSVYNAGSEPILFDAGQPLFLIWFSDVRPYETEPYNGEHNGQDKIKAMDVQKFQGDIASPGQLKSDFHKVSARLDVHRVIFSAFVGLVATVLIVPAWKGEIFGGTHLASSSVTDQVDSEEKVILQVDAEVDKLKTELYKLYIFLVIVATVVFLVVINLLYSWYVKRKKFGN